MLPMCQETNNINAGTKLANCYKNPIWRSSPSRARRKVMRRNEQQSLSMRNGSCVRTCKQIGLRQPSHWEKLERRAPIRTRLGQRDAQPTVHHAGPPHEEGQGLWQQCYWKGQVKGKYCTNSIWSDCWINTITPRLLVMTLSCIHSYTGIEMWYSFNPLPSLPIIN